MSDVDDIRPVSRFSYAVLADCAQREVRLRRKVYPNRILTGCMSHAFAQAEIEKMRAIAEMLVEMANKERLL
jgi:hypothetical protein